MIEVSTSTLETRDDDVEDIIIVRIRCQKEEADHVDERRDETEEEEKMDDDNNNDLRRKKKKKKKRKKWCWRCSNSGTAGGSGANPNRPGLRQPQPSPPPQPQPTIGDVRTTTTTTTLFWSSPTSWLVFGLLSLYVWSGGHVIFYYATCYVIWNNVYRRIIGRWMQHVYDHDPELWRSILYLRRSYRTFWRETDRVISGDYGRQVVAAYLIHACTAPGESYLAFLIRHKMHILHYQWIDELNRFGEQRLGYEPSQRDIMFA